MIIIKWIIFAFSMFFDFIVALVVAHEFIVGSDMVTWKRIFLIIIGLTWVFHNWYLRLNVYIKEVKRT